MARHLVHQIWPGRARPPTCVWVRFRSLQDSVTARPSQRNVCGPLWTCAAWGGVDLKPPLNVGAYFTYTHTLKHTNTRTCIHEQKQTNYQTLTQDRMIAPDRMIPPVKHQRFATTHLECRSRNSGTLPRQRFSGSARDPIPQSQTATSQSVILHPCIAPVSPAPPPDAVIPAPPSSHNARCTRTTETGNRSNPGWNRTQAHDEPRKGRRALGKSRNPDYH